MTYLFYDNNSKAKQKTERVQAKKKRMQYLYLVLRTRHFRTNQKKTNKIYLRTVMNGIKFTGEEI